MSSVPTTSTPSPVPPVVAAAVTPAPGTRFHCPYRQATLIQQALAPDKMRVAFMLGAGCPLAIRIPDGSSTKPLIPDIQGLTKQILDALPNTDPNGATMAGVLKRLADSGKASPNIEEIFSYLRALHDVAGTRGVDGLTQTVLADLDKRICEIITHAVNVPLPNTETPYHRLAAWVGGIRRTQPVEMFTPNYDLLIEQALEECRVPYFDGFVGSRRTFFDLAAMEQDVLPVRWAHLWKPHGSINWWRTPSGEVERRGPESGGADDRQMIYPSHLKYDQSRRQPYLAMLDRLRAFLSKGQAVLVTCGYSFADQHLNEVILQGLAGNPSAICFGLLFGDRSTSPLAIAAARKHPNLSVLAADGAVIGTLERSWHSDEKPDHPLHGLAAQAGDMKWRSAAEATQCKFLLGDFKAFGDLLAQQLADSDFGVRIDGA